LRRGCQKGKKKTLSGRKGSTQRRWNPHNPASSPERLKEEHPAPGRPAEGRKRENCSEIRKDRKPGEEEARSKGKEKNNSPPSFHRRQDPAKTHSCCQKKNISRGKSVQKKEKKRERVYKGKCPALSISKRSKMGGPIQSKEGKRSGIAETPVPGGSFPEKKEHFRLPLFKKRGCGKRGKKTKKQPKEGEMRKKDRHLH